MVSLLLVSPRVIPLFVVFMPATCGLGCNNTGDDRRTDANGKIAFAITPPARLYLFYVSVSPLGELHTLFIAPGIEIEGLPRSGVLTAYKAFAP